MTKVCGVGVREGFLEEETHLAGSSRMSRSYPGQAKVFRADSIAFEKPRGEKELNGFSSVTVYRAFPLAFHRSIKASCPKVSIGRIEKTVIQTISPRAELSVESSGERLLLIVLSTYRQVRVERKAEASQRAL